MRYPFRGIRQAHAFFEALVDFLPLLTYLYFEGTSIAPDVWALLEANTVAPAMQIRAGTLWPKPSVVHSLANEPFLQRLAGLARRHAEPEICVIANQDLLRDVDDGRLLRFWLFCGSRRGNLD